MSKLRSFNIDLAQLDPNGYDSSGNPNKRKNKKVELLLLGDNYSLSNNDIDSLPVMIAIKNSIEQFRGGSDNSLDVVNFENPTSMQQFQEIWREEERDDDDDDDEYDDDDYEEGTDEYPEHGEEYDDDEDDDTDYDDNVVKHKKTCNCNKKCTCNKKKKKQVKKKPKQVKCTCTDSTPKKTKVVSVKRKPGNNKPSKRSTLDKQLDNFYTDMLNKGCDCILSNVNPQPPQIIYQKPVKVIKQPAPVVIQNATVDANFIEAPAPKKKINWNCVKTQPPRPRCKSKVRQKWRNKIDRAVEKRTERSLAAQREGCDCSRRRN